MSVYSKIMPLTDQTRRGQIVRGLRDLIISAQLPPGTRLTETELATQLGVSRAPLREAIRELVDIGLLQSVPYKGLFVRTVTPKDLEELYSLRTALEKFAFEQSWDKRSAATCDDLKERHSALISAIEANDPLLAIEQELKLHSWCYQLSGHELLQAEWARLLPNLQFYFTLHQKAHSRSGPSRGSHDAYVKLACGDDLDMLLKHLDDHMQQGLQKTLNFIAQYKETVA